MNVLDDELALQFSRASYSISETGKIASIAVTRSGPTNRAVSVDYTTSDGTAMAGLDYIARSGTLTLPAVFAGYRTNENAAQAIIAVTRSGGAAGGVTVNFATSDGTALAGTHYVATNGLLTFGRGKQ